jgi:hypothetical protein
MRRIPRPLAPDIALADSGLSVGTVYVLEVSLQVEEVIVSNSKCVLLLFLAFCVIRTHRHPASARYVPLGDYGLVKVGPLSTPPLSPLVLSFISPSPFHWTMSPSRGPSSATADSYKNLDDVVSIPAPTALRVWRVRELQRRWWRLRLKGDRNIKRRVGRTSRRRAVLSPELVETYG